MRAPATFLLTALAGLAASSPAHPVNLPGPVTGVASAVVPGSLPVGPLPILPNPTNAAGLIASVIGQGTSSLPLPTSALGGITNAIPTSVPGVAVPPVTVPGTGNLPAPTSDPTELLQNLSLAIQLLQIITAFLGGSVPGLPNIGVGIGSNNPLVQQLLQQVQKLVGGSLPV